jgi:diketogulonate reductase-like aldo/keto reductase
VRTRTFGRTGTDVVVIGQGTWKMEPDRKSSIAAIRKGLELGMTHIDTAEIYGSGKVEELVAEAIADRRDEVFLVSKVWPRNASYDGTRVACERSLRRLDTDHLDVYLLHWPSGDHRLEETIRAFKVLKDQGKVRHFGVSNFEPDLLERAISLAGPGEIVCNQVEYHLKKRSIESELIPFCIENDVAVVGYSPFGQGRFPERNRVLKKIAAAYSASTYQVALKFLTRLNATFAIPKASNAKHVEDNAAADDLELTEDDLAMIDEAFPL